MHIVDGVLSLEVLTVGAIATCVGVAVALTRMDPQKLPQTAMMSAVFFIASLIHIPFGPTSVHFIGNGLIGLTLGIAAFPALLIALVLQAVFFGFGGVHVLGINTLNTALPAVLMYYTLRPFIHGAGPKRVFVLGCMAGSLGIALSTLMVSASLVLSGEAYLASAKVALFSHLPLMVIEGGLTGAALSLLLKVKPDFLDLPARQIKRERAAS